MLGFTSTYRSLLVAVTFFCSNECRPCRSSLSRWFGMGDVSSLLRWNQRVHASGVSSKRQIQRGKNVGNAKSPCQTCCDGFCVLYRSRVCFFFLPFTRAWIRTLGKVALWGKLDCFIINQNIPPTAQYAFLPFWRVFTFRRAQLP